MKWTTLTLIAFFPLAIFAKDMGIPSHPETLIEDGQTSLANETEDKSIKEIIDPAEATKNENIGNTTEQATTEPVTKDSPTTDPSEKTATADSQSNDSEEIAEADSLVEDSLAQSEAGAESEDAEAELAADMNSVDSATVDSASRLVLDMTTAFVPTASRRISAPYGIRTYRMHRGVDLGLCHGEDRTIVAAFKGVVVKVRNQGRRKGYGKFVIMDHGNGLTTLYAHLASWQVNVGDTLQAGDTIGVGGNTGRSFGAHLHFEMRFNGNYIDPATVFNFADGTYINAMTEIEEEKLQLVEADFQKELSKHRYYKVRRGDCLGKIARKYGISITRLKQLNGIKGNMIRPGQVLRCS